MKIVNNILFQTVSTPEDNSLIVEFLDEKGDAFAEINCGEDGNRQIVFYRSDISSSMSLVKFLEGVKIAEETVFNKDTKS